MKSEPFLLLYESISDPIICCSVEFKNCDYSVLLNLYRVSTIVISKKAVNTKTCPLIAELCSFDCLTKKLSAQKLRSSTVCKPIL